jgi:flagellar biosynthesis protein FlhF
LNVRTFTARDADEALRLVKAEFGTHAVVLHTRHVKRGGLMGLCTKPLIEITAADAREVARQRGRQAARSPRARAVPRAEVPRPVVAAPDLAEAQTAGDLIRRTYQAARTQFDAAPEAVATAGVAAAVAEPTVVPPAVSNLDRQLSEELQAVRQLVERVVEHQETTRTLAAEPLAEPLADPLVEHYAHLIKQEIAAELADQLVRSVDPEKSDDIGAALQRKIEALLPVAEPRDEASADAASGRRPRVIALVGPTGVGKTTTVAKLAATYKLKQNKKVGLITADTYRIAAVEQLRTYAQIINLPLQIVSSPDDLQAALGQMADMDVVLLDTAGRSQRNGQRLDELARLLEVAQPQETHLVLAATASPRVMDQIVERFSQVKTDQLIFTKLDEAVSCGAMLNVAHRIGKPLSYITTGQEVPHQIEACEASRVAALVLGREAVMP